MEDFEEYPASIDNIQHRARMEEVLGWAVKRFPDLSQRIAWNQPMFTDHVLILSAITDFNRI